jgi:hypothetical protein
MEDRRDHWPGFLDFCAFEGWTGGPAFNVPMLRAELRAIEVENGGPLPRLDRAWLAACLVSVYSTGAATVLWHEQPVTDVLRSTEEELAAWLEENKYRLPVHSDRRRTHGARWKLAKGLKEAAEFVADDEYERGADYDRLWAQVTSVPHVGRYFGIKLAGALNWLGCTDARQYDIRANGAKNGRKTLGLLFGRPDVADHKDNSKKKVRAAEDLARAAKGELEYEGLRYSWFEYEALLCEYNQMVKGSRYPGKTPDGEQVMLEEVLEPGWGRGHQALGIVRAAREMHLPDPLQTARRRKDLMRAYPEHGYVWCDAIYDRDLTEDPAAPAVRPEPLVSWRPRTSPERVAEPAL